MADQGQAEYRKKLRERFLSGETDTRSDGFGHGVSQSHMVRPVERRRAVRQPDKNLG